MTPFPLIDLLLQVAGGALAGGCAALVVSAAHTKGRRALLGRGLTGAAVGALVLLLWLYLLGVASGGRGGGQGGGEGAGHGPDHAAAEVPAQEGEGDADGSVAEPPLAGAVCLFRPVGATDPRVWGVADAHGPRRRLVETASLPDHLCAAATRIVYCGQGPTETLGSEVRAFLERRCPRAPVSEGGPPCPCPGVRPAAAEEE